MQQLAILPEAISVRRSELLSTNQDHGENTRLFLARLNDKVATCTYAMICSSANCTQLINFTDVIVKDAIVAELVDDEVKKDVLVWTDLDEKMWKN